MAQNDVKRILSFHIVSQIGYMVLGLGCSRWPASLPPCTSPCTRSW
ncbi:MAG: proton-conducting transporter membrane subunit [Acidimicrobiales bacterium]